MAFWLAVAMGGADPPTIIAHDVTTLAAYGEGSLRAAVASAEAGDSITFAGHVRGEIVFDARDTEIVIDRSVRIIGPGAGSLAISGGGISRLLHVTASGALTIEDLTLKEGRAPVGGALWNEGHTELTRCVLTDNTATESGGAIYNAGRLKLVACSILRNQATGSGSRGGGICSLVDFARGWLEARDSTLAWNRAGDGGDGGAIFSEVSFRGVFGDGDEAGTVSLPLRLVQTTLSSNKAARGGGLFSRTVIPGSPLFLEGDVINLPTLASKLQSPARPFDAWVVGQLSAETKAALATYHPATSDPTPLQRVLLLDLNNRIIRRSLIYDQTRFVGVNLRQETADLLTENPQGADLLRLNRLLIEDAFPREVARMIDDYLAVAAIGHCTIAFNDLSGIHVATTPGSERSAQPRIRLSHSIIAGNRGAQWAFTGPSSLDHWPVESLGYNLTGDGSGKLDHARDQQAVNPMLGPLSTNSGLTLNHVPEPGSPAIDAGDPAITNAPAFDQRGFVRVLKGNCAAIPTIDIGTVEFSPVLPPDFEVDFTNILPNRSVPLQNFAFPLGVPKTFVAQLFAGQGDELIGPVGGPVPTSSSGFFRGGNRCLGPEGPVAVCVRAWDSVRDQGYDAAVADREAWVFQSNDFWVTNAAGGPAILGGLTSFLARPPLRWAEPAPVEFGTPLTTNELNARLDVPFKEVNYTIRGSPAVGARLCPGEHELVARVTPVNTTQYRPVVATNMVKVQVRIRINGSSLVVKGCPDAKIEFRESHDLVMWALLGAVIVDGNGEARLDLAGSQPAGTRFFHALWVR